MADQKRDHILGPDDVLSTAAEVPPREKPVTRLWASSGRLRPAIPRGRAARRRGSDPRAGQRRRAASLRGRGCVLTVKGPPRQARPAVWPGSGIAGALEVHPRLPWQRLRAARPARGLGQPQGVLPASKAAKGSAQGRQTSPCGLPIPPLLGFRKIGSVKAPGNDTRLPAVVVAIGIPRFPDRPERERRPTGPQTRRRHGPLLALMRRDREGAGRGSSSGQTSSDAKARVFGS
jgi:hypothetical protein